MATCQGAYGAGTVSAPTLSASESVSNTGYFHLTWSPASPDAATRQYELQQANDPQFSEPVTILTGPDRASVISGFADQVYFFRVREHQGTAWSTPVRVEVKHHSLTRALGFFGLGAIVFALMLGVLLGGMRSEARL